MDCPRRDKLGIEESWEQLVDRQTYNDEVVSWFFGAAHCTEVYHIIIPFTCDYSPKKKSQEDAEFEAAIGEATSVTRKKITSGNLFTISASTCAILSGFVFLSGWQLSSVVVRFFRVTCSRWLFFYCTLIPSNFCSISQCFLQLFC